MKKLILLLVVFGGMIFAQDIPQTLNVTITAGQSLSAPAQLRAGCIPGAFITPSTWVAANLSFQISNDGGTTWGNLKDENKTEIVVQIDTAGDVVRVQPADWYWAKNRQIKIRSGTAAAAVVQTSTDKVIKILCGR